MRTVKYRQAANEKRARQHPQGSAGVGPASGRREGRQGPGLSKRDHPPAGGHPLPCAEGEAELPARSTCTLSPPSAPVPAESSSNLGTVALRSPAGSHRQRGLTGVLTHPELPWYPQRFGQSRSEGCTSRTSRPRRSGRHGSPSVPRSSCLEMTRFTSGPAASESRRVWGLHFIWGESL